MSPQIAPAVHQGLLHTAGGVRFGAVPRARGVDFRVFCPDGSDLRLHVLTGAAAGTYRPDELYGGIAGFFVQGAAAADRYCYTIDDSPRRPDPASRFQPDGVHGPSEIVDPRAYRWRRQGWRAVDAGALVIYELHVGAFTPEGTFRAARERLPALRDLGVTAVELMPVAEFSGSRNWGYDGVCLFAPSRNYGRPDDLRDFVDAAHELELAVLLDVVYNHLGPEGAYLPSFNPDYLGGRHSTPWGGAVNLDGPRSASVRRFIIDSARHWVHEYRLDGLRLDATHALVDDSATHLVAELVDDLRETTPWPVMLHAEDHRNLVTLVQRRSNQGWGLDAVWADDFHHTLRRQLAGDAFGYFEDYEGSVPELAQTIRQGWYFTGQPSRHLGRCRGTDPSAVPMRRFIVCLQNHDQIGNRATGDRLNHAVDPAAWRAASTLLLTVPMTPLLFMGQEWAASTPFQYFTDLEPALGRLVTEGRRAEFRHFPAFSDPGARLRIPDPQAPSTFAASKLRWEERATAGHQLTLNLYRTLLGLRRRHPALGADEAACGDAVALDAATILMRRAAAGDTFYVLARLRDRGEVSFECEPAAGMPTVVLTTEDGQFAADSAMPRIEARPGHIAVEFQRPGAVILRTS